MEQAAPSSAPYILDYHRESDPISLQQSGNAAITKRDGWRAVCFSSPSAALTQVHVNKFSIPPLGTDKVGEISMAQLVGVVPSQGWVGARTPFGSRALAAGGDYTLLSREGAKGSSLVAALDGGHGKNMPCAQINGSSLCRT